MVAAEWTLLGVPLHCVARGWTEPIRSEPSAVFDEQPDGRRVSERKRRCAGDFIRCTPSNHAHAHSWIIALTHTIMSAVVTGNVSHLCSSGQSPPPCTPFPTVAMAAAPTREDYLMEQFRAIANRYEISEYFAKKLKQLEG